MRKFSQALLLWCCVGVVFAGATTACGGDDEATDDPDDPPPPPPPPPGPCEGDLTADQFGRCFNDAYAEKIFGCGFGDPGAVDPDRISPGLLGAGYGPQEIADIAASIAAGSVEFDGAKAQACLQQLAGLNCVFVLGAGGGGGNELLSACDAILVGQVANGDACGTDYECATGFCVGQDNPWDLGTACDPAGECVPFAALGASCNDSECAPGNHCEDFNQDGNYLCESGDADAACNSDDACDAGHLCALPTFTVGGPAPILGTCEPAARAAEGEPCNERIGCNDGAACLPIGGGGQPICTKSDTAGDVCFLACDNGLSCVAEYVSAAFTTGFLPVGTCTSTIPGVGDDCLVNETIGQWGACGAFLVCEGQGKGDPGTCEDRGGIGAACGGTPFVTAGGPSGNCNLDLFCSDEVVDSAAPVCTPPQPAGAFCTENYHCASGACSASGLCIDQAVACEEIDL